MSGYGSSDEISETGKISETGFPSQRSDDSTDIKYNTFGTRPDSRDSERSIETDYDANGDGDESSGPGSKAASEVSSNESTPRDSSKENTKIPSEVNSPPSTGRSDSTVNETSPSTPSTVSSSGSYFNMGQLVTLRESIPKASTSSPLLDSIRIQQRDPRLLRGVAVQYNHKNRTFKLIPKIKDQQNSITFKRTDFTDGDKLDSYEYKQKTKDSDDESILAKFFLDLFFTKEYDEIKSIVESIVESIDDDNIITITMADSSDSDSPYTNKMKLVCQQIIELRLGLECTKKVFVDIASVITHYLRTNQNIEYAQFDKYYNMTITKNCKGKGDEFEYYLKIIYRLFFTLEEGESDSSRLGTTRSEISTLSDVSTDGTKNPTPKNPTSSTKGPGVVRATTSSSNGTTGSEGSTNADNAAKKAANAANAAKKAANAANAANTNSKKLRDSADVAATSANTISYKFKVDAHDILEKLKNDSIKFQLAKSTIDDVEKSFTESIKSISIAEKALNAAIENGSRELDGIKNAFGIAKGNKIRGNLDFRHAKIIDQIKFNREKDRDIITDDGKKKILQVLSLNLYDILEKPYNSQVEEILIEHLLDPDKNITDEQKKIMDSFRNNTIKYSKYSNLISKLETAISNIKVNYDQNPIYKPESKPESKQIVINEKNDYEQKLENLNSKLAILKMENYIKIKNILLNPTEDLNESQKKELKNLNIGGYDKALKYLINDLERLKNKNTENNYDAKIEILRSFMTKKGGNPLPKKSVSFFSTRRSHMGPGQNRMRRRFTRKI